MKIIAASIAKVTEAADTFLHAGYISAYPRPLNEYSYPDTAPVEQLDVVQALQLKGETLASGSTLPDSASPHLLAGDLTTVALVAAAAFGLLAVLYLLRHHLRHLGGALLPTRPAWGAATVMAALALVLLVRCGGEDPLPTEPPWKGVKLEQYKDPQAATKVLLHGIIAEAIGSMDREISILPNIQNETRLPAAKLTSGQAYALKTYGIDGWGRPFRLDGSDSAYTVTSAGADGSFGTSDDLKVKIDKCDDQSWDMRKRAFFLRQDGAGALVVLFHRWTGTHFEYLNPTKAQQLTGGETFDLFAAKDLPKDKLASARQAYQQVAGSASHTPMVLQVF
jgi:hypothetical protein